MSYSSARALLWTLISFILMGYTSVFTKTPLGDESCDTQERALIEAAVASVADSIRTTDIREIFAHHLRRRGAVVPEADKAKYWQELKAKPELRNTPIYSPESEQARTVLRKLKPIFALFGRDWDVAVIEQDMPFSGAFRQSIYIVSTGGYAPLLPSISPGGRFASVPSDVAGGFCYLLSPSALTVR